MRFGTMFSGGEGVGVGLTAAGLHHVWGIEYDADIAAVAQRNGFDVHVADVRQVDYASLPAVDWLHASPVCTRASNANPNATESQEDIDTAAAVIRALDAQQPAVFTLENVWQYRTFQAFTNICDKLGRMGYFWTYDHVNAADFGGEIRCPLHDLEHMTGSVLSAANTLNHDFLPRTSAPDIAQAIAMMLPDDQAWHLAWDAVGHLVRVMQQDIAANAAWRKLADELAASAALKTTNGREAYISMNADMFAFASMASIDASTAWLLNLCLDAPLLRERWSTISTETHKTTARLILSSILTIVLTSQGTTKNRMGATRNGASGTSGATNECPLCHVSAVPQTRQRLILRASRGLLPYLPEPVRWVGWITAIEDLLPALPESKLAPWQYTRLKGELRRPVLINQTNTMEVRETWEPAAVQVSSSRSNRQRAVFPETGRVVQMTPRALARFQSFPDSYILPERRQLAARVIGNAVPPLLMQRIAEDMLWAQ